jgi:hypothetical protein
MNLFGRPPGPEGLLDPFLASTRPTDEFNSIQDDDGASVLADSAKKYKMVIFKPKHKLLEFFGLVPKSPTHAGLICVKTPKPNISCLGSFNQEHTTFSWSVLQRRDEFASRCSQLDSQLLTIVPDGCSPDGI